MGLFNRKQKNAAKTEVIKMITDIGNGFYSWNGKLYQSDMIRACIRPAAKAVGKMVPKHILTTVKKEKKEVQVNPRPYMRFLLEEPNPYMSGQMMQEKVVNQLLLNGNAFILIYRDEFGTPCGMYPIPASTVEANYRSDGELYLKFYYPNGQCSEFPYSEIIHLRNDFIENDIFGEPQTEALTQLMNVVSVSDQGVINAIKNSAVIKWLLKFTNSMRPEDIKLNATEFANNYLDISNGSIGVAAVDSKAEAIQVKPQDYVPNAAQTDRQKNRIYAFFNTNDKIVHSLFSEDEWISYYEQSLEPIGIQLSREYTRKLFTRKERGYGNEIIFESSSLTYASMETKLKLTSFVDRAIMTPNEVRAYFNLPPLEGGDEALLRKDTEKIKKGESE